MSILYALDSRINHLFVQFMEWWLMIAILATVLAVAVLILHVASYMASHNDRRIDAGDDDRLNRLNIMSQFNDKGEDNENDNHRRAVV